MGDVAVGVTIAVISSVVGTLGKQLLRYAELQRQSGGSWASKAQVLGVIGQMVMSPVLDIVALGWAPQTVLAPFNGLSLVWNTILAVRIQPPPAHADPAHVTELSLELLLLLHCGRCRSPVSRPGLPLHGWLHLQPFVLHESLSRSRVASCGVITLGMVINGMASSSETKMEHVRN